MRRNTNVKHPIPPNDVDSDQEESVATGSLLSACRLWKGGVGVRQSTSISDETRTVGPLKNTNASFDRCVILTAQYLRKLFLAFLNHFI